MTLKELIAQTGTQLAFARLIGCDPAVLNRIVKGRRGMGASIAVRIFKATGHRFGDLADDGEGGLMGQAPRAGLMPAAE